MLPLIPYLLTFQYLQHRTHEFRVPGQLFVYNTEHRILWGQILLLFCCW